MDPNLKDTCIFMEANPGDKGNHNPNYFWESADIGLNAPPIADKAQPGQPNTIPSERVPEPATVRVVRVFDPTAETCNALRPGLSGVAGFKRISNALQPNGFSSQLPDFSNATITDRSRVGCLGLILYLFYDLLSLLGIKIPALLPTLTYEAQFQLQPKQITRMTVSTDLASATREMLMSIM